MTTGRGGVISVGARMAVLLVGLLVATASRALASEDPQVGFSAGVAALKEGAFHRAVDLFEALADEGYQHPDASFDRALAYIGRVRVGADRPGNLGRAAAALEEVLLMRPDDHEAETALETVRAEVARRRARNGASADVEAKPSLERALMGLASETTWSVLALTSSLVLTIGLALRTIGRKRPAVDTEEGSAAWHAEATGSRYLASTIATPIGVVALVIFASLAAGARHLRMTMEDGVIVVPEARLTDDRGMAIGGGPVPEAAKVELSDQRGGLVHIRWGTVEGFVPRSAVLRISSP